MILTAAVVAAAAHASPDGSEACRAALDALASSEAAAAEARAARHFDDAAARTALAAVQAARGSAARWCLRLAAATQAAGHDLRALPPLAEPRAPGVLPALVIPPAAMPPALVLPSPAAPSAVVRPSPAAVPSSPSRIVACDAGGCWADDSALLPRVGGAIIGPRGLCSVVGAPAVCP